MENTVNTAPVGQLKTNKGLLKTILLSLITFGIYPLVVMSAVSTDINVVASRYDGKKTMHYCLLFFIVAPITCGIASIVWSHKISNRIGAELKRRGLSPIEQWEMGSAETAAEAPAPAHDYAPAPVSLDEELENRQRKFGMMMKPFQI